MRKCPSKSVRSLVRKTKRMKNFQMTLILHIAFFAYFHVHQCQKCRTEQTINSGYLNEERISDLNWLIRQSISGTRITKLKSVLIKQPNCLPSSPPPANNIHTNNTRTIDLSMRTYFLSLSLFLYTENIVNATNYIKHTYIAENVIVSSIRHQIDEWKLQKKNYTWHRETESLC